MLFNSKAFLFFFILVFISYYLFSHKYRWLLLLISSCLFYMYAVPGNIIVPLVIVLIAYWGGINIEKTFTKDKKRLFLIFSLLLILGALVFFKYANFLMGTGVSIFYFFSKLTNIQLIPNTDPILLNIIVPIGISYISFQAIGYLIEIYSGNHPPEKNIGIFASYLMFFPKLLSGPIERAHNFIPQLNKKHEFEYQQTVDGLKLVAWGFFKKIVIADRIAMLTDQVFNNVHQYSGIPLIIGVLLFTVQLYADFSGYTDIALGIAKTLGFKLTDNFNIPFIAKSTKELWRRWHISLSTWFNDYVFNTIVINKRDWNKWAIVYATMVTFLILGLWHGSSWNFVIFGFIQGLMLSLEFLTMKIRKRIRSKIPVFLNNSFGIIFTFSFFSFALIFFRANNFSDAIYTISHLFDIQLGFNANLGIEGMDIYLIPVLVFFLFFIQFLQIKGSIITRLSRKPVYFRWMLYCTLVLSILFFGLFSKSSYIYLQF